MKRALKLLLWLLSATAFADGPQGAANSRTVRGNFVRIPVYQTPGSSVQSYFVDSTNGNDTNSCRATLGSACATIQGAINKIPKQLRDQVTVNVAAGNYAGFILSGFDVDNGVQQTTGGVLIDGALITSTVATGTATGTASSGTAGSGSTFGTLVDSTQSWTTNDLRGRFITTATPTNATFVISSNTSTSITVEGVWSSPTGSTTYTIQDPSVVVAGSSNGATLVATPLAAASANNSGVFIYGNTISYRNNAIVLRNMRIASTNTAMTIEDSSSVEAITMQFRPSAATASGISYNNLTTFVATGGLLVTKSDVSVSSSGFGVAASGGALQVTNSLIRNATANGVGVELGVLNSSAGHAPNLANSEILGFVSGFVTQCGSSFGSQLTGVRISCSATGGPRIGISLGNTTPSNGVSCGGTMAPITNFDIETCDVALQVIGVSSADVASMTGTTDAGFMVSLGGIVSFSKSGVTLNATTQINEDFGGLTANFSDVTAGSCVSTVGPSSRVCGR